MRRFFQLLFGDWGLLVSSIITCVLSGLLFPLFMAQVLGTGIINTALAVLLGIFAVGFYASSALSSLILSIRSGISKKWVLLTFSLLVVVADIVILIINLV